MKDNFCNDDMAMEVLFDEVCSPYFHYTVCAICIYLFQVTFSISFALRVSDLIVRVAVLVILFQTSDM